MGGNLDAEEEMKRVVRKSIHEILVYKGSFLGQMVDSKSIDPETLKRSKKRKPRKSDRVVELIGERGGKRFYPVGERMPPDLESTIENLADSIKSDKDAWYYILAILRRGRI